MNKIREKIMGMAFFWLGISVTNIIFVYSYDFNFDI